MMRMNAKEAEQLLINGDPIQLGQLAGAEARKRFGDRITFIVDRNINYTNVCVNECRFCAFFRRKESKDAYLLTFDEILGKVREAVDAGATQVMIQGGLYPDLGLEYYEKMLRLIKENFRITIGRQYGSGGKEVGRILAQKLGIPFYGKEELMKIAKDQPDYEEVRAFYEEQPVNSLLYAIAMEQGENRTGKVPFRKIRELCGSKSCILIGRCGSYIFREDPSCVKIFIYADMEKKIQWIENQENVSARKAKKLIEKVEEERAQFHKFYTGGNWGNVNDYDLCLDAGVTGTQKAADIIMAYLENRGFIKHG